MKPRCKASLIFPDAAASGATTANYQVTFEPINPDYILSNSVGLTSTVRLNHRNIGVHLGAEHVGGSAQSLTVNVETPQPAAMTTPLEPRPRRACSPPAASGAAV